METPNFTLANLCDSHRSTESAFQIGQHVKVTLVPPEPVTLPCGHTASSESIWVCVTDVNPIPGEDTQYTGYIDNDPVVIKDLKWKDEITFTAKSVKQSLPSVASH